MGLFGILGIIAIVVGVLGLLSVVSIGLIPSILIIVGGLVLVAADNNVRRRLL